MGEESQDEGEPGVVVKRRDQPVIVAANVEHGDRLSALHHHRVGVGEDQTNLRDARPPGVFRHRQPSVGPCRRLRMFAAG